MSIYTPKLPTCRFQYAYELAILHLMNIIQRKLHSDDIPREVLVYLWDNYVQYEFSLSLLF